MQSIFLSNLKPVFEKNVYISTPLVFWYTTRHVTNSDVQSSLAPTQMVTRQFADKPTCRSVNSWIGQFLIYTATSLKRSSLQLSFGYNAHRTLDFVKQWCVLFVNHLTFYWQYEFYGSIHYVSLIVEIPWVTTVCCFRTVLINVVPRGLPVHYYTFHAIQKVHFIISSFCYNAHFAWLPKWALYRGCSVVNSLIVN